MNIEINFLKKRLGKFCLQNAAASIILDAASCGARVGVACSGGADSMFLLLSVMSMLGKKNFGNINVLHFNHKARANAELDEAFVRDFCTAHSLNFICSSPERPPQNLTEDTFRQMRLAFFKKEFAERKLVCIAQGHHCGDVAETLLMRLMRGAGIDGLCAPREVSELDGCVFVRPMLGIKKSEICAALKLAGLDWREDESNGECKYFRNKVRNILIPKISELSLTDFFVSAKRTHALLNEDADFLTKYFNRKLTESNPSRAPKSPILLDCEMSKSPALIRRAVMKLLSEAEIADKIRSIAVDAFVERVATANSSFKTSAGENMFLHFDFAAKHLSLEINTGNFEQPLKIGKNILPDGGILSVKRITLSPAKKDSILRGENDDCVSAYLEMSAAGNFVDDALTVRNKRDGDSYAPLGSKSKKRLKDIFVAKKIPSAKRNSIPIVCNKRGDILWGVGLPPCEKFKMRDSSVAIELTYISPFA